jgi:hypothetical protein
MILTPAFQSISQRNKYTGVILAIKIAVEFPTLECAQAIQARLGGKLVAVPANDSGNLYVTYFDTLTGSEDVFKYALEVNPGDLIYPRDWNFPAPKPPIPNMSYHTEDTPPNAPNAESRVLFSQSAGHLADCFRLQNEAERPAYSYWSAGKTFCAWSGPEQAARNLIILSERNAYRLASGDESAPGLFAAG